MKQQYQGLYIPTQDGLLHPTPFDPLTQTGFLGDLTWVHQKTYAPDVWVLIHGFELDPGRSLPAQFAPDAMSDLANPHGKLYHFMEFPEETQEECHCTSWPLRLGLHPDGPIDGIGFGWESDATVLDAMRLNCYRTAYDWGTEAAVSLAQVVRQIPARINFLVHSLGSHVVNECLQLLEPTQVQIGNVVVLSGAEVSSKMQGTVERHPTTRFINLVNRQDMVIKWLAENFSEDNETHCLGYSGLQCEMPNWLDLEISSEAIQEQARHLGFNLKSEADLVSVFAGETRMNHWVSYTHADNLRYALTFIQK